VSGAETATRTRDRVHPLALLVWVAILIGLPILVVSFSTMQSTHPRRPRIARAQNLARPPSPPPVVEPVEVLAIAPTEARTINAAVPFSTAPNPAARAFHFAGALDAQERAVDCLASAQYYEAGDDASGQKAVAQVVLNRLRHPAFPKSVCGVVFQGSERTTGCQFTFTCDGALARTPSTAAWERARALARQMLDGAVDPRVGYATHYHTDWVVPYWSASLDKITSVGTHLFFRWKGWWGTPPAFRGAQASEPVIAKLAFLSTANRGANQSTTVAGPLVNPRAPDFSDMMLTPTPIDRSRLGDRFGPAQLAGVNAAGDAFILILDAGTQPAAFEQLARQMCAGRAKCRLLGWTDKRQVPGTFPINAGSLRSMGFAYLRLVEAGVERIFYDCRQIGNVAPNRCLQDRTPFAAADVTTVKLPLTVGQ
jgi:spore germination cell wall hydrolase CwlJ-like protein